MKHVIVSYKVKSDRAAENVRYIEAVFEQLDRERPAGLRYASFKLDDGVSFVHVASIDTADGTNPLLALSAFKAFAEGIKDRCEQPPVTAHPDAVGVYDAALARRP